MAQNPRLDDWYLQWLITEIRHNKIISLDTDMVLRLAEQARHAPRPEDAVCADCPRSRKRIAALEREVARLEAAARQPAHADPDLARILGAVETLRARLYPDAAVPFPRDLKGRTLGRAEERLVEDQVYAWRHPPDGGKPPTFQALAERLRVPVARVRHWDAAAARRHDRVHQALGVLAQPDAYVTPEPVATTAAVDSEA